MRPSGRSSVWLVIAGAGAAVLCCAGPTLLILAASGVGAMILHSRASLVIGIGLVTAAGIGCLVWRRRQICARRTVPALRGSRESPR